MSIEFHCSDCNKLLRVADGLGGKRCKCPSCNTALTVPSKDSSPPLAEDAVDIKVEIPCPKCQSVLLYSPNLEGTRGLCKACQHIFTISLHHQEKTPTDTFAFQCPKCSFLFEGKHGMQGKKGKCTECKEVFVIQPLPNNTSSKRESVQPKPNFQTPIEKPNQATALASPNLLNPLKPPPAHRPSPTASASPTSQENSPAQAPRLKPDFVKPRATPVVTNPLDALPPTPAVSSSPSLATWDTLDLPAPNWSAPASIDRNPYAAPSVNSPTRVRLSGRPLTIANCLSMVKERIWPIVGWSLVPTGMIMGIALVEFVLMVLGFMVLGAIGVAIQGAGESSNVTLGLLLIFGMLVGGFVFAIPYFLVLPSYWQIALDGIRGRQLSFETIQKGVRWSGWLFLCFFAVFLFRFVTNLIVGTLGGIVLLEFKDAEIYVRMASAIVGLLVGILTLPVHMIPFALADGLPIGQALSTSSRYVFGNFWRFIGLSLVAGMIFWVPTFGILISGAFLSGVSGVPAIMVLTILIVVPLVAVSFPGFYACYAAFYALAKEND